MMAVCCEQCKRGVTWYLCACLFLFVSGSEQTFWALILMVCFLAKSRFVWGGTGFSVLLSVQSVCDTLQSVLILSCDIRNRFLPFTNPLPFFTSILHRGQWCGFAVNTIARLLLQLSFVVLLPVVVCRWCSLIVVAGYLCYSRIVKETFDQYYFLWIIIFTRMFCITNRRIYHVSVFCTAFSQPLFVE